MSSRFNQLYRGSLTEMLDCMEAEAEMDNAELRAALTNTAKKMEAMASQINRLEEKLKECSPMYAIREANKLLNA